MFDHLSTIHHPFGDRRKYSFSSLLSSSYFYFAGTPELMSSALEPLGMTSFTMIFQTLI